MKCECCGEEFTAKTKRAKFCSDRCRLKNHRPSWIDKYNRLVRDFNKQRAVTVQLYKVVGSLLSIAGEPNKAKRTDLLNKITMTLMAAGCFETMAQLKAEESNLSPHLAPHPSEIPHLQEGKSA